MANFVETETLLEFEDKKLDKSYVIIRGSVPIEWSQENYFTSKDLKIV